MHFRIAELVRSGKSFALESTLSGVGHLKTISLAKQNGYKVVIVYTFVDSPSDCLARIQSRVQNGGHPVPDEDVIGVFIAVNIIFGTSMPHWRIIGCCIITGARKFR